jgi:hypothetical protein
MIRKELLVPDRVRRPPREGWSWIDRRFLREHAARLSHEAITLYLFLAAVSDQRGLSFYSDTSTAIRLRMSEQVVVAARDELVAEDLVAYRSPLTQVLSLPQPSRLQRGGLTSLGEMFRALEFFQGSPRKVIFDNLKAAVISGAGRYACLHSEFLALCGHFCLEPIACAARDPESKGIVEDGVRYVKRNALAGRSEELVTWEDYRRLAPQWRGK